MRGVRRALGTAALLALAACGGGGDDGEPGAEGASALVNVAAEPAGSHCADGGSRIDAGSDTDGDGVLATAEITTTRYICDGAAGAELSWQHVTGPTVQAVSGVGYLPDSTAQVTITLPADPAVGDIVKITGVGNGGWKIAQNAGQRVRVGSRFAAWTARSDPASWSSIARSADGSRLVAAAGGAPLHTSVDGGVTWTVLAGSPSLWWGQVALSADGTRLAAVGSDQRIYMSTDSGASWTARGPTLPWGVVAISPDGTTVLAANFDFMVGGLVYRSSDSGVTWAPTSLPLTGYSAIEFSADGSTLVAAAFNAIHVSSDGGVNWVAGATGYFGSIALSADGKSMFGIAASSGAQIQTSSDAGATWSALSQSPSTSISSSWIAASTDGSLLAFPGNDGVIHASSDAGASWHLLATSGKSFSKVVSSVDGNQLIGAMANGPIYTTRLTSSPGTAGFVTGRQHDSVTLQYFGGGLFSVVASESPLAAF